ncbi:PTS sugar transporter subunit IIB [Lapidilactobacillus achengensis]|uniref:PTS sugar transporter subunit IIB n=1 Tax=Lapidilactobacillus achengensis TaxID=2486000 RepID=A0ABW1UPT0_9LACO|nr:PTS sugar transporter subunit IIB [Lapidilactobacillus achengensis]
MIQVLFVCSQGMSSAIAEKALLEEAKKQNVDLDAQAVSTQLVEKALNKTKFDVLLVAPQIKHRYSIMKEYADAHNIPAVQIEPMAYSPLGGKKLLKEVQDALGR